ncbi:MAG TPA: cupredoxin domain-containing protein [Puia sp.]|nr:cupredoxin domain-containing protein [Puia sp.]
MKSKYVLSGIVACIIAAATLVACKKYNNSYSSSSPTGAPTIYMKGSAFSSANVQISAGAAVMWNNDDTKVHTVTANDGSFNSGDIQPGSTFSWAFKSVGTFAYHDTHTASMTGVVVVVANSMGGGY